MSYTGWVLVLLAALVVGYLTPNLIRYRQQVAQLPVEDRFSTSAQMVSVTETGRAVRAEPQRKQPQILACKPELERENTGPIESIEYAEGETRMSADQDRRYADAVPSASREMARLRARRAARIAAENAAGKRRFALSVVAFAALVTVATIAFIGIFSWAWTLIPASLLAAVLVNGRLAYRRSVAASVAETEELKQLRAHRRNTSLRYQRVQRALAGHVETTQRKAEPVEGAPVEREDEPQIVARSSANDAVDATEAAVATGWTLREMPPPTYAKSARLGRRQVSAEAVASVQSEEEPVVASPVRPTTAKAGGEQGQSSAQAAAEAPVAFDLEDVLQLRRAQ
ncbi:MAG: hypothetical protein Q4P06_04505 [Actinomycetaceae bacterium]|nr:hypothetical protein [Actinomycetaceae bacterium]